MVSKDVVSQRHVLMTGATGFIGRRFMEALLEAAPDVVVWAIVRPAADGGPRLAPHPRLREVSGDLCAPALGVDPASLPGCFEAFFHLAAETDFKEKNRERTVQANMAGTREALALAKRLASPGTFYYVSTAYVAGTAQGEVGERLAAPRSYFNPYEESKHAAEALVAESGLDWSILRPSILVGDSTSGDAASDKMVYGVIKTYFRFREVLKNKYDLDALEASRFAVHGRPSVPKNLICLDDVIRLMLAIFAKGAPTGSVFHLTNPRPTTNGAIHDAIFDVLGLRCLYLDPVAPAAPSLEEKVVSRGLTVYKPYMTLDEARFDQTALRDFLGPEAVEAILPMTPERLRFLFGAYVRQTLQPPPTLTVLDGGLARLALVRRFGRGPLAYSTIRPDVAAVALPGGRGYVPYALKGRTAVLLGDPICAPEDRDEALAAVRAHCLENGLGLAGVQLGYDVACRLTQDAGHANRMGDEALLDLGRFDLTLPGKAYAQLRRWRNSAETAGITVREATFAEVPAEMVAALSSTWLAGKVNGRELGFLLRPLPTTDEPDVRKFFAFQGETLVGMVFFDPLYADGAIVGYYANIVRYAPAPNGIHDAILLEAVRRFQAEGRRWVSLGLAPLSNLDAPDHPRHSPRTRDLLRRLRDEAGAIYNFTGVSRHKAHYHPEHEPTYFYSPHADGAGDLLDVFSLVGLMPPEVLRVLGDETFEMLREA